MTSELLWMWFGKKGHEHAGTVNYYAMTLWRMSQDWDGAPSRARKQLLI